MPELLGLVLCGGRSRRMGRDKSWIRYHAAPQSVHAYRLLREVCDDVRVSARRDQEMPPELFPFLILDEYDDIGPAGGLLSAHRRFPRHAILALACDVPFVRPADLSGLRDARGAEATAYGTPQLEPLVAIWEPAALEALSRNVRNGNFSLRAALSGARCVVLPAENPANLRNVNEARELEGARAEAGLV